MRRAFLLLSVIFFLLFLETAYSAEQVSVEFLYWDPSKDPLWCPDCDPWVIAYEDFLIKNATMQDIQDNYSGQVWVNWTQYSSTYGQTQRNLYGVDPARAANSLVIKGKNGSFVVVQGDFNESYIRQKIDEYLQEPPPSNKGTLECHSYNGSLELTTNVNVIESGYTNSTPFVDFFDVGTYTMNATWLGVTQTKTVEIVNGTKTTVTFQFGSTPPSPPPPSSSQTTLAAVLGLAFYFGFFETFSPCIIALLSFVLSYSVGETVRFKEGLMHVIVFGLGFVTAAVFLGLAFGLVLREMPTLHIALIWVVCVIAILLGLDLLGLNLLSLFHISLKTKPLVRKLSKRFAFTYAGLFLLGFIFYFLDPCLAPFFVASLPLYIAPSLIMSFDFLFLVFLVFCIGVMVPFFAVGLLAGSISKLARSTYRHRTVIRGISGLVLICYALYLIITYIIRIQ